MRMMGRAAVTGLIFLASAVSSAEPDPQTDRRKGDRVSAAASPVDNSLDLAPLTKNQAQRATEILWQTHLEEIKKSRAAEVKDRKIVLGDKVMKFSYKLFGEKPADGRRLFLSMHGGGNAPAAINDQQYENQKRLYSPAEGVYLAPRAPTNTSDLWHEKHIDAFFERLIEDMVALEDVNPDRVYLMGYSAGGDGVYQVAPRMADRFAAAAMMAGHPNEASPLGLRNLPFAIHVGALDAAYQRNAVAQEWGDKLQQLHHDDPQGYNNLVEIHTGRAHWMNREDRSAVKWMSDFRRDSTPKRVVWYQDDVTHDRFYWLAVEPGTAEKGTLAIASLDGQTVKIEKTNGIKKLIFRFNDRLINLDEPIRIVSNDKVLFEGPVIRTLTTLKKTLNGPGDRQLMFSAEIAVAIPQ